MTAPKRKGTPRPKRLRLRLGLPEVLPRGTRVLPLSRAEASLLLGEAEWKVGNALFERDRLKWAALAVKLRAFKAAFR